MNLIFCSTWFFQTCTICLFNVLDITVAQNISKVSESSVASVDDFVPDDADQSFNSFLEESPKHSAQEKASDVPEEESERYFPRICISFKTLQVSLTCKLENWKSVNKKMWVNW